MKILHRHISVLCFLVMVSMLPEATQTFAAEEQAAYADPGQPGPYRVGLRTATFVDTVRGRTLKTFFWYPALGGDDSGAVIPDGEPDHSGGPYPLIMFSHGHTGTGNQSTHLTAYWASHGFVVAAPNHEKNTRADYDPIYLPMLQFARSVDLRFVTDQILDLNRDGSSFLHGMVEPESIGVTGHSFGGHTTLTTAGATPDLDHLAEYCKTEDWWDICPLQKEIQALYPGQRVIDESDPRMKAALALAPDAYGWFQQDGMAKIQIPIMIMAGEKDNVCPPKREALPMYDGIRSEKYLMLQEKSGHLAYCDYCGFMTTAREDCPRVEQQIKTMSTAFWRLYLKGEEGYRKAMQDYAATQADFKLLSEPARQ
ncbi:MAG: hypothetical protein WAO20_06270 [Acidobacteriota bacterium]